MNSVIHRTSVPVLPGDTWETYSGGMWEMQARLFDAVVELYRRSRDYEETGRCYVWLVPDHAASAFTVNFIRTERHWIVEALRALSSYQIHKLSDDQVLRLFMAA